MTRPFSRPCATSSPIAGGLLLALALALPVAAGGPKINKDRNDVAIRGYDTVAYFTEGRPVRGRPEFEYRWQQARWHFTSAEHRDLFAGNPEAYAPQYGGNCAGGMALGKIVRVDPEAWAIVDGKLYLNYAKRYVDDFVDDAKNQIPKADANWKKLGHVD